MKSLTIEFCNDTPRSQLLFRSLQERLLTQEMAGEIRLLQCDDITGNTTPLLSPGCPITSPTPSSSAASAQAASYFAYATMHIPASKKTTTATATTTAPLTPSKRPDLKRS